MNKLQEQMDKIMGDYDKLPTWFKRRVSEELLEDTFKLSLLEAKRAFYNSASTLNYSNFEYHTIYNMISKFYKRLPDEIESWITGIANALMEYYGDKIMEEYQTL